MPSRILWLDNDRVGLGSHIYRLEIEGYRVKQVFTVTDALLELDRNEYDLLILDAMLSVLQSEEKDFPANSTNGGQRTGLVFYQTQRTTLERKHVVVLVLTIREDADIREAFMKAKLPPNNFAVKWEVSDTGVFVKKVASVLGDMNRS